jgi:hypothetical protein
MPGVEDPAGNLLAGEKCGVDPFRRQRRWNPRRVSREVDAAGEMKTAEVHLERSALQRRAGSGQSHPLEAGIEVGAERGRPKRMLRGDRADRGVALVGEHPEVSAAELAVALHQERLEPYARKVVFRRKADPG